MKVFKSLMPQLKLKYVTTDQKKVKIQSSDDAYQVLKTFYDPDTLEYQESSVAPQRLRLSQKKCPKFRNYIIYSDLCSSR